MLKFLLIFFIVIYVLGYVGKWFFAHWIKKMSNQQMNQKEYNNKKEGEVTIDVKETKNGNKFKGDGDYVDYEEVND